MEKINIAMFSDSFYPIVGGRENVIHNLMTELSKQNKIFLLTTTFKGHKAFISDSDLQYKVIRCKSLRITRNEYLSILDRRTKKIIESKIQNGEIDIIHTQTKYALTKYALKLKKKYGIPVVTSAHTNYISQYKNQLKLPFIYKPFLNYVKKIINKTDAVFTVSKYMENLLIEMGVKTPIHIIPNGNDLIQFKNKIYNTNQIKQEFKLEDSTHILLYSGRITETKNLDFLFKSLTLIKDNFPNFKLLLVGSGKIKKYKRLASSLGLADNCLFTGAVTSREKLAQIYKLADLYLYPSTGESYGLTIREAGIMGTPSITIENCATSENIIHNKNGFISKNNINDFSIAIIKALSDSENLKEVSRTAATCFDTSWETIAELHIKKYKDIINKKNSIE